MGNFSLKFDQVYNTAYFFMQSNIHNCGQYKIFSSSGPSFTSAIGLSVKKSKNGKTINT